MSSIYYPYFTAQDCATPHKTVQHLTRLCNTSQPTTLLRTYSTAAVVERGEKGLLSDPGYKLSLGREEKEKEKCGIIEGMSANKEVHNTRNTKI